MTQIEQELLELDIQLQKAKSEV